MSEQADSVEPCTMALGDAPVCAICMEELPDDLHCLRLDCGHKFHTECACRLFLASVSNVRCPLCRDGQPQNKAFMRIRTFIMEHWGLLRRRYNKQGKVFLELVDCDFEDFRQKTATIHIRLQDMISIDVVFKAEGQPPLASFRIPGLFPRLYIGSCSRLWNIWRWSLHRPSVNVHTQGWYCLLTMLLAKDHGFKRTFHYVVDSGRFLMSRGLYLNSLDENSFRQFVNAVNFCIRCDTVDWYENANGFDQWRFSLADDGPQKIDDIIKLTPQSSSSLRHTYDDWGVNWMRLTLRHGYKGYVHKVTFLPPRPVPHWLDLRTGLSRKRVEPLRLAPAKRSRVQ